MLARSSILTVYVWPGIDILIGAAYGLIWSNAVAQSHIESL